MMLVAVFTMLTILRSLRDDFAVEIWAALGFTKEPSLYTRSELWVMLVVISVNAAAFLIASNRAAFFTALYTILGGFVVVTGATVLFVTGGLDGFLFMVLLGIGAYTPYVAFHTTLFERMIALFRDKANLGYLMYLADAVGYLGVVAILLLKNLLKILGDVEIDYLTLIVGTSLVVSVLSLLLTGLSVVYFRGKATALENTPLPVATETA